MTYNNFYIPKYVLAGTKDNQLHLGGGSLNLIVSPSETPAYAQFLLKVQQKSADQIPVRFQTILHTLLDSKIILPVGRPYDPGDRFSRQKLFFDVWGIDAQLAQERLHNSHVTLLGGGGIGNEIGSALACMGVGKLTIIDDDVIEESNLTRQFMFTEAAVGASKSQTLQAALLKLNSTLEVEVINRKIASKKDTTYIPKSDLLVLSADSHGLIETINSYCVSKKQPFLHISYILDISAWGPFYIPGISGCRMCRANIADEKNNDVIIRSVVDAISANHQAPSFVGTNKLSSSLALFDIFSFLVKDYDNIKTLNKRIGLHSKTFNFESQDFMINPQCTVCGTT